MSAPRFKHDCDSCEFMGPRGEYDAYWCARADGGSVLLRYGDKGEQYASYPAFVLGDQYLNEQTKTYPPFMLAREIVAAVKARTT